MKTTGKLSTIRCGKFVVQIGFLRFDTNGQAVGEATIGELPKKLDWRDMPIICTGWLGSGYLPFFHSLN